MERRTFILSLLFIFFLSFYFTPQAFPQDAVDETEPVAEEEQANDTGEKPKEIQGQVQPPVAPAAEPAKQGLTGQQPQEVKQPLVEPHQPTTPQPPIVPQPPIPSEPAVQQAIPLEPGKQPAVVPVVPQPPVIPQPPAVPQQPKAAPTVSFFFDDADIYEV
ncbi:MAG: hypothetical protein MUO31_00315, partial [Thermodesulfovibrionales bacterium]|nr:hypothetical protein [Thermodesulfovibrionales bacterium]